ncbi:MAG: hypothetical protein JXB39_04810, partial [Deltaproteobacteria bacterium]|nr:hypothetical protein [Deltaproteobacteria bacterium]
MTWPADLALSLVCVAVAAGGRPWVRAWERRTGVGLDGPTRWAAAAAVSFGLLQVAGMLLGFLDLLRPWTAALAVGSVLLPALLEVRRPSGLPSPWVLGGLGLVGVLLALALVPPWYQDDMTYHLALPRTFAQAGGAVVPDDNIFASLPLGWESVLSLLCALGPGPDRFPPFNPRLPGAWIAGAAALATAGLARSMGASGRIAGAAGLLLLLLPTFVHWAPSGYVEAWLVLLVALALQGGIRLARQEGAWLVPTAVAAGLAASVKHTGLGVTAVIWALLAANASRDPRPWRQAWAPVVRFAWIALLVGCPFYVRNLLERGNPFFPWAWSWFGGEGWDAWRAWAWGEILAGYGAGRSPIDWLLLPVRLFTTRDLFHGFEGSFGPFIGLG